MFQISDSEICNDATLVNPKLRDRAEFNDNDHRAGSTSAPHPAKVRLGCDVARGGSRMPEHPSRIPHLKPTIFWQGQ